MPVDANTAIEIARRVAADNLETIVVDGDSDHPAPTYYGAPPEYPRGHWIVSVNERDRIGSAFTVIIRKADGQVVFRGMAGE